MTDRQKLCLVAAAGSAAILLGALGFQYLGHMPPCKLCLWQRWPHAAAMLIGGLCLFLPRLNLAWLNLAWLGALAALATAAIGAYHAGVEQKWWPGPTSCTGGGIDGLTTDELFEKIMDAPLVRCDEIPWEMMGISMAGWNAILSLVLALIWVRAARVGNV